MSGPFVNQFGDVISSALTLESGSDNDNNMYSNYELVIGQVSKIYDIKDDEHPHGTEAYCPVYDVMIMSSDGSTSMIKGCIMAQPTFGGGVNNFMEVIQTDPKFDKLGSKTVDSRDKLQSHYVIVGFISGNMEIPIILGTVPHPNKISKKVREKFKSKDVHTELEIQGLNVKIDKEGQFTLTYHGPREDDPVNKKGEIRAKHFKGEEKEQKSDLKDDSGQNDFSGKDAPTVIHINKDGNVTLTNNVKQRVHVDRVNKTIRIDNDKTYINMIQGEDGAAKVSIVANQVDIGHSNKDTVGSMDGGNQNLQPMVVGDDWQFFMEELIKEIMKIYVPTGTGPSGNPVNNPKFQALMKRLPEVLSKKHKVEK